MGNWFTQNAPAPSTPPPAAPPSGGNGGSWFSQNAPSTSAPAKIAAPTSPASTNPANPRNEGIYQMQAPDGRQAQVPYSQVKTVAPNGYRFQNAGELARYAKDHAADPVDEGAIDHYLANIPWWDVPGHTLNLLMGAGAGVEKTAAGLDRAVRGNGPLTGPEQELQLEAAAPTHGVAQGAGELGENIGEFFTGEELLGMIGKGLQGAEKLKAATGAAQFLEKYPVIAKLAKIGQTAVRQGAIGGAQTYAKTGGDTQAAIGAGAETAALGGALETGGKLAAAGARALAPKIETGAADYAAEARAAVRPHLESVAKATDQVNAAAERRLPAGVQAVRAVKGAPAVPKYDVNLALNTIHDFTGAADELTRVNDAAYDAIDKASGGKFRQINSEVQRAQKAAFQGGPAEQEAYKNATKKMEDLLTSTRAVSPEALAAIKAGWKQSYQLRDIGAVWDRALNGVAGATKVSQAQRGINGNVLMKGLQKVAQDTGRAQLEATLGPGRLENLETIARLNQTNAQRVVFNRGVHEVARYLPIYLGARIGEHVAGFPGEMAGAMAGAAVKPAAERVLDAIKANPKIGQYLTYAIEYGADPAKYGPVVATMIQKANTEASQQGEGEQQ